MAYENPPVSEKRRLYPERASANIDALVDKLKKLETGEAEKIELTEEERKELLDFESKLGEALEKIYLKKINTVALYPEYFTSVEGKEDFIKTTKVENFLTDELSGLGKFLLESRNILKEKVKYKDLEALGKRSRKFVEEKTVEELMNKMDEAGEIDITGIENPKTVSFTYNPETALEKIKGYNVFRRELKNIRDSLKAELEKDPGSNLLKAKSGIVELYRRRVNEFIFDEHSLANTNQKLADLLGEESLLPDEKEIANSYVGVSSSPETRERRRSRIDKFMHGSSQELAVKEGENVGYEKQIGEELKNYAEEIENKYLRNQLVGKTKIIEKGLDPEKIYLESVPADIVRGFGEELISAHGLKSDYPSEEYDAGREGPALDSKWQSVIDKTRTSAKVDSKQRAIRWPDKKRSIVDTLGNASHEYGHFLQAINRQLVPLRLFQEMGSDRSQIFAEGGAMNLQDFAVREAFGIEQIPHPHYIRAMLERLNGGDYLHCVEAFYKSGLGILKSKKESGLLDSDKFTEEAKKLLKMAIDRAKRLFRGGGMDFSSRSGFLTSSKDSVYVEQDILLSKLRENGLEKYIFLGRANLESLILLSEIGLLDSDKIQGPKYEAILEIWERIKDQYKA